MPDLTYSVDDLRGLAEEALERGDIDGAIALAENASDTEEAQED